MKVIGVSTYRDGGTKEIVTSEGTFWKDGRISSSTRGKFYKGDFPGKDKSRLLDDEDYEICIMVALEQYENRNVTRFAPKTQAKDLVTKFFSQGKLNILQAKFAADLHVKLILDLGIDMDYWLLVKNEINNRLLMMEENQEIDNVN